MLIPIAADVPFDKRPFVNWLFVAANTAVFCLMLAMIIQGDEEPFESWVLDGWTLKGFFGHMWLHGGIMHLIGNMLFLWIFGNAVCYKLGNLMYPPAYILLGLISAVTHNLFMGGAAVGASGAINGVVGMYLVFFPTNNVEMFYWFGIIAAGTFEISGYWVILSWFAFDILGAAAGGGYVAYFAHIGGFLGGVTLAFTLLLTGVVKMEDRFELSLLDVFRGKHKEDREPRYNPLIDYDRFREQAPEDEQVPEEPVAASVAPPNPNVMISDEDFLKFNIGAPAGELAGLAAPDLTQNLGSIGGSTLEAPEQQTVSRDDIVRRSQRADAAPKPKHRLSVDADKNQVVIRFYCPCGQRIKVPASYAGKKGKCPQCRQRVLIPARSEI